MEVLRRPVESALRRLTYYNTRRRHSAPAYLSPLEFEQQHHTTTAQALPRSSSITVQCSTSSSIAHRLLPHGRAACRRTRGPNFYSIKLYQLGLVTRSLMSPAADQVSGIRTSSSSRRAKNGVNHAVWHFLAVFPPPMRQRLRRAFTIRSFVSFCRLCGLIGHYISP